MLQANHTNTDGTVNNMNFTSEMLIVNKAESDDVLDHKIFLGSFEKLKEEVNPFENTITISKSDPES